MKRLIVSSAIAVLALACTTKEAPPADTAAEDTTPSSARVPGRANRRANRISVGRGLPVLIAVV